MKVRSWVMTAVGQPLSLQEREDAPATEDEVLIEVEGCGICHTDLGYLFDGVPVRGTLPLALGHEISGRVVEAGTGAQKWLGREVVVPAVLPCGRCERCLKGRASICPQQIFPGNDVHGGFSSHVRVPSRGLCPVPDLVDAPVDLCELAVLADAVTTPWQSIRRSGLGEGDLAVFVGVGGVGGFGVQLAAALGATAVAVDVDAGRLEKIENHGASLTIDATGQEGRQIRKQIRGFAREHGLADWGWKVFETSGAPAGQELAFGLLNHGAYLGVVGYTPKAVSVRVSNLMAFDARAEGSWGCVPELYPEALDMILSGRVAVRPFVEKHPLSDVNEILTALHAGEIRSRPVLVARSPERE